MNTESSVEIHGVSHTGLVRDNNEDHYLIAKFGRSLEVTESNLSYVPANGMYEITGHALVVADGIGGNAAGEIASEMAVNSFLELVLMTPDWILRLDDEALVEEVKKRTRRRAIQVSQIMLDQAAIHPEWDGFGTTMTAAWSLGKDLFVMNIGDSRAYLFRNNQLMQLTSDHTLAQELVRQGVIRQDEVATNRFKNVLTKCLGSDNRASEPDVQKMTLFNGDVLLLCTDGLTDMVEHDVIAGVLAGTKSPMIACEKLLSLALEAGGKDNVSIIVARYQLPPESPVAAETDTTPG